MNVTVVGSGSWGSAFSRLLVRRGHQVQVLTLTREEAAQLNATHENPHFLPGVMLPPEIAFVAMDDADIGAAELVVYAVPTQVIRTVARWVAPRRAPGSLQLSLAKGYELGTLKRPSQAIHEETGGVVAALSGPNHAEEVSRDMPSATVIACEDDDVAGVLQQAITCDTFRVYTNDDIVGVEYCGAVKNPIAVAVGMSDGLGFGDNSRASLITRSVAEMTRLGLVQGAHLATFTGLAGIGDLIATCTSRHSRNRLAGELLAKGASPAEVEAEVGPGRRGHPDRLRDARSRRQARHRDAGHRERLSRARGATHAAGRRRRPHGPRAQEGARGAVVPATAARRARRASAPAQGAWLAGALARGCALFFGGFTLVSIVGATLARAFGDFDATVWWIALPWLGQTAGAIAMVAAGVVLVAYAAAPAMRAWRRRVTATVCLLLAVATAWNGIGFYEVWRAGLIRPAVPLPLSFVLGGILLLVAAAALWAPAPQRRRGTAAAFVVIAAAACALAFPVAQVFFFGETDYRREAAVAVVFGAQVHDDGRLSTSLRDRMDTAIELYQSGMARKLLVSGGVGESGHNEAFVMRDAAIAAGVPAEDVLVDGNGVNTEATVRNTRALVAGTSADANGEPPTLLAVSQFYHLPRIKLTYARAGYDVLTVPARASRPIAQTPALVVREIPAFWVYYLRAVFG